MDRGYGICQPSFTDDRQLRSQVLLLDGAVMLRELRYGCRSLLRTPGFVAVVIVTLGIGIGANVTMFSVMYSVLWRPLPYPHADRLVLVSATVKSVADAGLSPREAQALRTQTTTLEHIAAVSGVDANLDVDGDLERVFAVSANDDALVALGGAPPALGRLLEEKVDVGDPWVRSVVISDGLWRRRLAADPSVIGRHIQMNNIDVEIVGVLRPGLRVFLPAASNAAEDVDVWFPRGVDGDGRFRDPATFAQLKPGVTLAQAQAELATVARRFVHDSPEAYENGELRLRVSPMQDVLTARVRPALIALGVAVAFVLLIACVNVTNLMLARAKGRARELAVRRALGAGRARVVRELLLESFVLAALGGVAGLVCGYLGVQWLDWLRPTHLPRQSQISVDTVVALYSVAISAAVCVVFGVVPAFRLTRHEDAEALKQGRNGTSAPGVQRVQRALVIAEVALSIIPLIGGGLMLRTFWNLTNAPIGFDPSGLLTAKVAMSHRAFPDAKSQWTLNRTAIDRVKNLPGVVDVSAASPLPLAPLQTTRRFRREEAPDGSGVLATVQMAFPGYLDLTRTRLREGRDLTDDDETLVRAVAMLDERLAKELWPDGAIGKRVSMQVGRDTQVLEVVGVTNPVRMTQVRDADVANVFVPYHVLPRDVSLVIRTNESAVTLGPMIRQAVESLGTGRPVTDIRPMHDYIDDSLGETRFTMLLLVGFAIASLLLAAVGVYGTLAYLIAQRTEEFGVRMALGATARSLVGLVVSEGALMTAIGAIAGLAGAMALAQGISGLLYGVTTLDATTVLGVLGLISLSSLAAAGVPAWRAARVDPVVALRTE